jgi:hypothetical protein
MRILILGGYGVFGGRLARLLIRDNIETIIAGRDYRKACAFTAEFGGEPLMIDLGQDLSPIITANPSLVVDAAGPFQAYEGDLYKVARFCIRHGINYLDFSDDADFTAGIAELDPDAVAAGCFALSGVSSVPAISAAAVRALSVGLSEILVIESTIVPGNRTPRGRSVAAAILRQAGEPLMLWRGGVWRAHRGWTSARRVSLEHFPVKWTPVCVAKMRPNKEIEPRSDSIGTEKALGPDLQRWANFIGVPDLKLFPPAFEARSVLFRAGLELGLMHWGLTALAYLRTLRLLPRLHVFLGLLLWASRRLARFGTDRGGMVVELTGIAEGKAVRRTWQVIADKGDGPFIPAIPALAITRRMPAVAPGARACLHELTLPEIERAMANLSVRFASSEALAPTLFEKSLGENWSKLPDSVRRMHSVQDLESFSGRAKVTRGKGWLSRMAAFFFRFPEAGEDVSLTITKRRTARGEIWERNFAGRKFRSYLSPSRPSHYKERFFVFTYEQELPVEDGSLYLTVRRGWCLGIPLPALLLPRSESREYDVDGTFHFDVGLYAPFSGDLIVRYQGCVTPDCKSVLRQENLLVLSSAAVATR